MGALALAVILAVSAGLSGLVTRAGVEPWSGVNAEVVNADHSREWVLSNGTLPIGKDRAIGLKLDRYRVMWLGGDADDPADNNRCFIYDIRSRTFRETAPIPSAKSIDANSAAGVLPDGTVVVAGGFPSDVDLGRQLLSYRYDPRRDRWTRTGDLPEPQGWLFTPANLLRDGRLIMVGGIGVDWLETGAASLNAFVYDSRARATVDVVDPETGLPTGRRSVVQGKWDYTRTTDGTVSTLNSGHMFGNAVLLNDGRLFVGGGHTAWNFFGDDTSTLATDTDYFDFTTGAWLKGAPFPTVAGEDDRIDNSHGGRTNGFGLAVLDNGKVVIAGGASQVDGESYFDTQINRQSILVMSPAANPMDSQYQLSPNPIPSGIGSGSVFGDGGRNQLLCYAISRNRVVIAGGQDTFGDGLFDTYVFDYRHWSVTRGPDMAHGVAEWAAQDPDLGYPDGYETATIGATAVGMRNSRLVFDGDVLVHGGGYNGIGSADFLGSRYVEQLTNSVGDTRGTAPNSQPKLRKPPSR